MEFTPSKIKAGDIVHIYGEGSYGKVLVANQPSKRHGSMIHKVVCSWGEHWFLDSDLELVTPQPVGETR